MKSLRRSLNNNGHAHPHTPGGQGPPPNVPPAPNMAAAGGAQVSSFANPLSRPTEKVAPPQKVIKALRSHRSTNPQELSYNKGHFWYVTGEREGWYEALNPLTGSRGLVPKDDFEEFSKGGRPQGGGHHHSSSSGDQSLSASQGGQVRPNNRTSPTIPIGAPTSAPTTPGKKPTQPLYAIVQYDFHAERPDELEAKAGEPIVVIAQSNHEWFVAKPIGRLGGPGLIPVTFVEIRDPLTGRALDQFPSTIPQVEEWKKATAEYKAAAIPLGRLDLPANHHVRNSPYAPPPNSAGSQKSGARTSSPTPAGGAVVNANTVGSSGSRGDHQRNASQANSAGQGTTHRGYRPEQDQMLPPGELVQLGVPSFHNESGNYWFRLHASFVPDDRSDPAYTLSLYRTYEDFYDFQITLLDTFPSEAGRPQPGDDQDHPPPRILPFMPGPVDEQIDDELTEYRRDELDAYVRALLDLRNKGAGYILRHELIRTFFAVKYGDYCEETPRQAAIDELEERLGDMGFESTNAAAYPRGRAGSQQSSGQGHVRTVSNDAPVVHLGHNRSQSSGVNHGGAITQSPSAMAAPFPGGVMHQSNHSQGGSTGRPLPAPQNSTSSASSAAAAAPVPFVKIKIYDGATDDLIALRVQRNVTYHELMDKVHQRLGPDISVLQYRLGGGGPPNGAAGGQNRRITNDKELALWMNTEDQRLVLYAEP